MFANVLPDGEDQGGAAASHRLVFCLRRRPGMSFGEFDTYWRAVHAPLVRSVASLVGIRYYVQRPREQEEAFWQLAVSRSAPEPFDGIAELEVVREALVSPLPHEARRAAHALIEDERKFIDLSASPIFVVSERQMPLDVPAASGGGAR